MKVSMTEVGILQQKKIESKDIEVTCPLCSKNLGSIKEIPSIPKKSKIKVMCPYCKEVGYSYELNGKPMFLPSNCILEDIKVLNENEFLIELKK